MDCSEPLRPHAPTGICPGLLRCRDSAIDLGPAGQGLRSPHGACPVGPAGTGHRLWHGCPGTAGGPVWRWTHALLRVLPFPGRTGLVRIGHPGRDAPVLLTGNYRLTVAWVKHALQGLDAWLLVANSRGVNVWCAATGGLLSHHNVVSVLKTSGIDAQVDHRELILPQLAATGVEERLVREKTGWQVNWGPVEGVAIPAWLVHGRQKTPAMRRVTFAWVRRLEMAVAWAFSTALKEGIPISSGLVIGPLACSSSDCTRPSQNKTR